MPVVVGSGSAAFASAADVAARWRPLTPDEQARADVLAGDASALIRAQFPGIDGQVLSGQVDPTVLTIVVAGMVKRAMIAPADGISQQSTTVGPYSESATFANPLQNVFLTAAEITLIRGYQPSAMTVGYANTTVTVYDGSWGVEGLYDGGITGAA